MLKYIVHYTDLHGEDVVCGAPMPMTEAERLARSVGRNITQRERETIGLRLVRKGVTA